MQLKAESKISCSIQALNTFSLSDKEREIYEDRRKAIRMAENEGMMKGVAMGPERARAETYEDKLKIAKKLRAKGFSRDDIIEITGLSGNSIAT